MKDRLNVTSLVRFDHSIPYHSAAIKSTSAEVGLWLQWGIASTLGGIGGEVLALSLGPEVSVSAFDIVTAIAHIDRVTFSILNTGISQGVAAAVTGVVFDTAD